MTKLPIVTMRIITQPELATLGNEGSSAVHLKQQGQRISDLETALLGCDVKIE